jgi:DNA-binding MarR family transcriptional regulator
MYFTSYICYDFGMAEKKWTFLSNHSHVLLFLAKNPNTTIRSMADEIGITERAVLGIIGDLSEAGYITIEKNGRRNFYKVNRQLKFRHQLESHKSIGNLIKVFS